MGNVCLYRMVAKIKMGSYENVELEMGKCQYGDWRLK